MTTCKPNLIFLLLMAFSINAHSACFAEAAQRYQVPVSLLKAISSVESSGNPSAIHRNGNGSYDIGHMQINSAWLTTLKKFGITQQSLFDACTNTYVGAWILAGNISRMGYSWEAIGAYNAASPEKRRIYAQKIASVLKKEGQL